MKKWLLETRLTYKQWGSLAVFVSCLLGLMVYIIFTLHPIVSLSVCMFMPVIAG